MRPDGHAAGFGSGGFDELGAADFLVTLRSELRDDEFALLIGEEDPVAVGDEEGVPPAAFASEFSRFPETLAGIGVQAAELSLS